MEDRYNKKILLGQSGNALVMLLSILAVVFCIFKFILIVYNFTSPDKETLYQNFYGNIYSWFILPSDLGKLMTRPWTLLTYMFMHDGVWHFIGNMIWLWIFGFILQDLAGTSKIFPLFIYGSLSGAALFLLSMHLFPGLQHEAPLATLEGASAGVMAIAVATTVMAPGYRFFPMINGGISLWVITAIYIVIDLAMMAGNDNTGGHLSHLGGAIFGFVFMRQLKAGHDWGAGMNRLFNWINDLFNPEKKSWQKTARRELHYKSAGTQPYKKVPTLTQKRIDEILDKIGEKGYHQLTDEEKQLLKRAAEDDNL